MKYKVGDKVRVKSDLQVDVSYGSQSFVELMEEYRGEVATIAVVYSNSYELDPMRGWKFTDEMLEDATLEIDEQKIRKMIYKELEACGIKVPIQVKLDLSKYHEKEKILEFLELTDENWKNAIYVFKGNSKHGDSQYYDLLLVVNCDGKPICVPVPIIREIFSEEVKMGACRFQIFGDTYEEMYKNYYAKRNFPF